MAAVAVHGGELCGIWMADSEYVWNRPAELADGSTWI